MGAAGDCDRRCQRSIAASPAGEAGGPRAQRWPGRGLHELRRRRHPRPIAEVWLEKVALERLGQLAVRARWQRTVLAAEANTAEVLGDRIATDLWSAGRALGRVTFPRRHGLLADGAVELGGVDRTLEKRKQSRRVSVPPPTTVAPARPVTARYRERLGVIC